MHLQLDTSDIADYLFITIGLFTNLGGLQIRTQFPIFPKIRQRPFHMLHFDLNLK
jgi:hypothetical protein